MLVGKVQSGKTSNLELLTALAFDNGYNILVIYGGYDTSLLKQTTERFMDTFDASGEITYLKQESIISWNIFQQKKDTLILIWNHLSIYAQLMHYI